MTSSTDNDSLHIGFLQAYFLESQPGGGEVHTEYMARELEKLGHDVTIYTDKPEDRREVVGLNVKTFETPIKVNPVNETLLAQAAREEIEKCDVVFLTDDSAWRGVDLNTPTAMIFHIVWHGVSQRLGGLSGTIRKKPQALWYARMEHKICKKTDSIVSISPNMRGDIDLIGDFSDKIVDIPNGVDTDRYEPSDESYNNFTVHFQGRLVEDKNPLLLVEAANQSEGDWNLKIGGNGPLKKKLQEKVVEYGLEDRVDILGYVSDDDLPMLYSKSDVYVLPSDYEGMPLTVIEAAASGTCVVVSKRAATDFVTEDMGEILNSTSAQELSSVLDNLSNDTDRVCKMSEKARNRAEEYSWKKIAKSYEELADNLSRQ